MAIIRIDVRTARTDSEITDLCEGIQTVAMESLNLRATDLHIVYNEHPPTRFIAPSGRSASYTLVEVTLPPGRRLEAKRKFYQSVMQFLFSKGIPKTESVIVLNEQSLENWGIRKGQAACDVELGFKLETKGNARIFDFHRFRQGLAPHKELGWDTREGQFARFEAICRWGDISNFRVLDLGCGYGDLRAFLHERYQDLDYLGIDLIPEFIAEATKRHGHIPKTRFMDGDFLKSIIPPVDIVFASGSLSYRHEDPLHLQTTLLRMWEIASKGIAFNMLNANVFESDSVAIGRDPEDILSFCRGLDPKAELVTGYLPEDFAILMRK